MKSKTINYSLGIILLLGLFFVSLLSPATPAVAYSTDSHIFINEIQYGHTAATGGDFVEIIGAARMNINNWTLRVYSDTGALLETKNLTGTFVNQSNGFGTIVFNFTNLPDTRAGLALTNSTGTLVEFLSYGGSVSAMIDGTSRASTNIYTGTKLIEHTIGRRGLGDSSADMFFSRTTPSNVPATQPETPGFINHYQKMGATVFINEFIYRDEDYDNTKDKYEMVEVAAPSTKNLTGWYVEFYDGNGVRYATPDKTLGLLNSLPLQNFAFGGAVPTNVVNGIGFTYHAWQNYSNVLNSYKGAIALMDPSGYVWHFISYGGTVTAVDGAAAGLVANDVGTVMADGNAEYRSIMLFGDGRILSDFYWGDPDNKTLGVYNDE